MPKVICNVWLGCGSYCRDVESCKQGVPSVPWGRARGHVSTQGLQMKREAVGGSEKEEGEDGGKRGRSCEATYWWCPAGARGTIT